MSDRYDPKPPVRPPGERKTAEPSPEADPLAELARIVSGRVSFDGPPPARAKAMPASPPPEPDVERDLEAELLNDLQASFAAIRGPLESASSEVHEPEPAEEPAPAPSARAAEPPPPRASEPPPSRATEAPKRAAPLSFDISQAFEEEEEFAPPPKAVRPEPPKPSPQIPTRGPAALPRGELPTRATPPAPRVQAPAPRSEYVPPMRGEPVQPRLERPAPPAAPPEKPGLFRRVAGPPRGDRSNIPVRPLPPGDAPRASDAPAPPRPPAPKAGRADAPSVASRFAPQRPAQPPRREAEAEGFVEDEFDLSDLAGEADGPYEDEFTLDDLEAAAYGPDEEFPPFPEEELADLKRRRSGRVFVVIAGVLAIVVAGGAAVFLYRSDAATNSPPPIIAADAGPTKIPPEEPTTAETDSQGKLIYDRVEGSDGGSDTRLVNSGEADIADIPSEDAAIADNPISRVIIPGGPGIDSPAAGNSDTGEAVIAEPVIPEAPAEDDRPAIGPRMVRTVVVRPDGTIVSSAATGVDEDGNALPSEDETVVALAPDAVPDPARSQMDAVLEGGDLPVNPDPLNQPDPATESVAVVEEAPDEAIPDPPAVESETPAALRPLPTPQPDPPAVAPQPTAVANTSSNGGPINLTPGTAPAAGAAQESGGGGVLVQVSAQRSEEAALSAYRGLQQRYPSILGAFQPRIVRADLGERGIYYRVRVGPFSNGDATRLCADLKAAGGECILAR